MVQRTWRVQGSRLQGSEFPINQALEKQHTGKLCKTKYFFLYFFKNSCESYGTPAPKWGWIQGLAQLIGLPHRSKWERPTKEIQKCERHYSDMAISKWVNRKCTQRKASLRLRTRWHPLWSCWGSQPLPSCSSPLITWSPLSCELGSWRRCGSRFVEWCRRRGNLDCQPFLGGGARRVVGLFPFLSM